MLEGANPAYLKKGSRYQDRGIKVIGSRDYLFKVFAAVDGAVPVPIGELFLDTSILGTCYITYSVTDSDGKSATIKRQVTVTLTGLPEPESAPPAGTLPPPAATTTPRAPAYVFQRNLKPGSRGEDVKELQKFLNSEGFIVAAAGPGSSGNETTFFGLATKKALISFQEAYRNEILVPSGLSGGNGLFLTLTRNKINEINSRKGSATPPVLPVGPAAPSAADKEKRAALEKQLADLLNRLKVLQGELGGRR